MLLETEEWGCCLNSRKIRTATCRRYGECISESVYTHKPSPHKLHFYLVCEFKINAHYHYRHPHSVYLHVHNKTWGSHVCITVFMLLTLTEISSCLVIVCNCVCYSMEMHPYELDRSFYSYPNNRPTDDKADLVDFVIEQMRRQLWDKDSRRFIL